MKKNTIHTRTKIGLFSIILMIWVAASCKKFVEIPPPKSQIEKSTLFANDQAAISAALGVYATMIQLKLNIADGGITLYPALSSDELDYNSFDTELLSYQTNSIAANDGTGNYIRLWTPAYKAIYNANSVLEGLAQSKGMTDTLRNQLKGEMLVTRALNYFCLVNLFGDVPLLLSTDFNANQKSGRITVNQIYDQLITDLTEAEKLLPVTYPSVVRSRPNKLVAAALLAKVYLYKKNWQLAVDQSTQSISSGKYTLESDLNKVFLNTSNEILWQLISDTRNSADGSTFIPSSAKAIPAYTLTTFQLNAFEAGDQRKVKWTGKNTVSGKDYVYPFKYKSRLSTPVTESQIVFRLAEQYLIRSEAYAQQGKLQESAVDLNLIRNRAGLTSLTFTDQASLLAAIAGERQTELFCEWGNRFFDLKRTGSADRVLGIEKKVNWQTTDALYPLPLNEVKLNQALTQNPGY
ncbi:MAG: outer membrane protein nutrient binding [Chitinophagaceae bacterium]|nr:outer membrane protein nutrient binding [Chitinophagaceae bacterium]